MVLKFGRHTPGIITDRFQWNSEVGVVWWGCVVGFCGGVVWWSCLVELFGGVVWWGGD